MSNNIVLSDGQGNIRYQWNGTNNVFGNPLSGTSASFASSGGSDTFAINHSSGSGIALNITKDGNGEGLYINKASGSGNAATIIGTLNATTLVKSGGTSSQFLMADGSVNTSVLASGAYLPLAGGTLTGNLNATTATFTGILNSITGQFGSKGGGTYGVLISDNDQSNVRLRFTNTGSGGQSMSIVGGNPGLSNAGLSIYDETNSATRFNITSTGAINIGSRSSGNIRNLNVYGATNNNAIIKIDGADGNGYGAQIDFVSKTGGGTSNTWTLGTGVSGGANAFELFNGAITVLNFAQSNGAATFSSTVATNGVVFPASQVTSADPNTLDDYEEGTWTPLLTGSVSGQASSGGATNTYGNYTKIGRLVTLNFVISLSSVNTLLGGVYLSQLPFNLAAGSALENRYPQGTVNFAGLGSLWCSVIVGSDGNTNKLLFVGVKTAASTGQTTLLNTDLTSSTVFSGSIQYIAS
jgi:hypothetical protein